VVTNNLTGSIPLTGEDVDITMYLNHPSGIAQETYRVKGKITDKTISADTNGFITNTFKIIQHNLEDEPQINSLQYTNYLSQPIYHRDVLYVYGRALGGVHTIIFDGKSINPFTGTDTRLEFILPKRTVTGPVILKGKGGKVQSDTLTVADPGIVNKKDVNSAGETVAEA